MKKEAQLGRIILENAICFTIGILKEFSSIQILHCLSHQIKVIDNSKKNKEINTLGSNSSRSSILDKAICFYNWNSARILSH
jgi:hypothetical protein